MSAPALLDVNLIVAMSWPQHIHHSRAREWFDSWTDDWATCSITELGLLRLSMNASVVGVDVTLSGALDVLSRLRALPGHRFLDDGTTLTDPGISLAGVSGFRQVTDVHLVALAAAHGGVLATLDAHIPEALERTERRHVLLVSRAEPFRSDG